MYTNQKIKKVLKVLQFNLTDFTFEKRTITTFVLELLFSWLAFPIW